MPKIRWSRSALEQLESLLQPIAQDDPELAVVIAKALTTPSTGFPPTPSQLQYSQNTCEG